MYTRCPKCKTTFRLTAAQLKIRDGQVRCGRCQHVFQADQHMVAQPDKSNRQAPRKRTTRKPAAASTVTASVPAPHRPEAEISPEPIELPPRPIPNEVIWIAGCLTLVLVALAQVVIFYGQPLGHQLPWLRPFLSSTCQVLPCRHLAPIDLRRIDLSETRVTPHPRYDRVLRVKAIVVNRAEYAQPFPLLEVSLIDHQGHLVARRAYAPRDYLKKPEMIDTGMPPNVAIHISLDITSPRTKASGYEVLLLPPSE